VTRDGRYFYFGSNLSRISIASLALTLEDPKADAKEFPLIFEAGIGQIDGTIRPILYVNYFELPIRTSNKARIRGAKMEHRGIGGLAERRL